MVLQSLCCTNHGSVTKGTSRKLVNRDKKVSYQLLRTKHKQLPKVQMVQAKAKGTNALIETAKIDHIWAKLKGA